MIWNGAYGDQGSNKPGMQRTTKTRGNKGIMAARRHEKRVQAKTRNKLTSPERRRSFARQYGYSRNSDRIEAGLEI